MFKGHTHKLTYFERYGREEQKGKRKKIKRTKIVAKGLGSQTKDLFPVGEGGVGIDVTRYVFSCALLMQ